MTNKEVVLKLQKYFLTQDPEKIARLCANFFLDLNRFFIFETLSSFEQGHLHWRNERNMKQVYKFLKDQGEFPEDLSFFNIPPTEDKGDA